MLIHDKTLKYMIYFPHKMHLIIILKTTVSHFLSLSDLCFVFLFRLKLNVTH